MWRAIVRFSVLVLLLTAFASIIWGQEPITPPKKKVPSMSNDDVGEGNQSGLTMIPPAADQPAAAKVAAPTPEGWARYSPDECGLSIALPGKPQELKVPPSKLVVSVKNYVYSEGKAVIMATHAVGQVDSSSQVEAEGFFKGLGATPRLTELKYSIDQGTGPRLGITANYVQNGTPLGLEGFVEVQGKHCWVLVSIYQRDSSEAMQFGKKVLATAAFDGPPCGAGQPIDQK